MTNDEIMKLELVIHRDLSEAVMKTVKSTMDEVPSSVGFMGLQRITGLTAAMYASCMFSVIHQRPITQEEFGKVSRDVLQAITQPLVDLTMKMIEEKKKSEIIT